ncbi:methyltransferase domain-containing protein [Gymnodinialimonas hymeniacidonis]|uniref:methyltransferase domain-containing protein n=1 Tax=Gymnodinialimonas hymeniacidonis TaxID=3126508 RepID=UPI0034C67FD7
MLCRHCETPLQQTFLDLGYAPPSNAYLVAEDLNAPELSYPLRLKVCDTCRLVQTEDFARADELFTSDYAYFSSTSSGWLAHAARYAEKITQMLNLGPDSFVIEVASNDGYLLKNFVASGIPCLGIEPTASTAQAARELDVPVEEEFFGEAFASSLPSADLIIGNNVYAHVPDLNDFTKGLYKALKPDGVITLEFPHLMRLVEFCQFDTVYHEHFSYLSLLTVERVFNACGLRVFNVEELATHGGSLRIYGCRADSAWEEHQSVDDMRQAEADQGLDTDKYYQGFQARANKAKDSFVAFLLDAKARGKTVAGYGAAAKGNTLMNYAGVKPDLLPFIADAASAKIGKFMPGSHIPILAPEALRSSRPDYLIIFPWNIAAEVRSQCADLAALGTQFVTVIPDLTISK